MKSYLLPIVSLILFFSCSKKVVSNAKDEPLTFHIVEKGQSTSKEKKQEEKQKALPLPFFNVTGLEGSWKLDISAAEIRFISENEFENVTVPNVKPTITGGNIKTYTSKSGEIFLELTITEGDCFDEKSQTRLNHIVKVSIKRPGEEEFKNYQGCGSYVPDERLNVVWTLKAIKGKVVSPSDFGSELPYVDLHTEINEFTGFAGCNRMKGTLVKSEGNQLKFANVITTRMACVGNNRESDFLKAFQAAAQYVIKDDLLFLYNSKDALLVFVRTKSSKVD